MKKLLFLGTLLFSLNCFAQSDAPTIPKIPLKDSVIFYEGIVNVDSTFKSKELYEKAREWFVNTYVDAKEVLQMDDKEAGKLIGKGVHPYSYVNGINAHNVQLRFTVNITVKDGKYRYQIYNFKGIDKNYSGFTNQTIDEEINFDGSYWSYMQGKRPKYYSKLLTGLDQQVQIIITSLQKAMIEKNVDKF